MHLDNELMKELALCKHTIELMACTVMLYWAVYHYCLSHLVLCRIIGAGLSKLHINGKAVRESIYLHKEWASEASSYAFE